jgi:hypothetical protein
LHLKVVGQYHSARRPLAQFANGDGRETAGRVFLPLIHDAMAEQNHGNARRQRLEDLDLRVGDAIGEIHHMIVWIDLGAARAGKMFQA